MILVQPEVILRACAYYLQTNTRQLAPVGIAGIDNPRRGLNVDRRWRARNLNNPNRNSWGWYIWSVYLLIANKLECFDGIHRGHIVFSVSDFAQPVNSRRSRDYATPDIVLGNMPAHAADAGALYWSDRRCRGRRAGDRPRR